MKKQLLSTSALVAAGLVASAGAVQAQTAPAASPITVTVGGFMSQFVSYEKMSNNVNISTAGTATAQLNKFSQSSDTEIYFNGKTTLANGISISMRVELEGNTTTDQIDESYLSIEGGFGRVDLGSLDSVANKMYYTAPAAYITTNGWAGSYPNINPTGSFGATRVGKNLSGATQLDDDDGSKINYYTPRIEGFQGGLTYTPQNAQDRNATGFTTGDGYYNGWAYGVNFVRTFGAVDVALSAVGAQWNKPKSTAAFNNSAVKDPKMWSLGGQVGFAGFKVGAGYVRVKDQLVVGSGTSTTPTSNTQLNDGYTWEVGGTYAFGPATVGILWATGTAGGTQGNSGGDHTEFVALDGDYKLGPGVRTGVRLSAGEIKGERGNIRTDGTDPDNSKFKTIQWGIKLDF